jgi:hypothetical protein
MMILIGFYSHHHNHQIHTLFGNDIQLEKNYEMLAFDFC